MAYLGNTLINGSLRCLNKAYFNDLSIGSDVEIAGKTTTNQLVVSGGDVGNLVVTNSSTGNIPVIIGNPTSKHIAMDVDDIQSKANATSANTLYINYGGGAVYLSKDQKISANNGVFKAESLGTSDSRVPNAYITTLDATTGNIETVNASDVTADNVTVNSVLKSSKWDISNVANLANDFMVAPTIKISSSGTVTIASLNTTAKTCRLTFSDSSQINSNEFGGCRWYAGSKVRVTFTVNSTLNSNILGTIVNNMNTTAGTLVINVTLDNTTNLANGTYEADDSTIMLYEISNSGTLSPVGIRMTAYGKNNSSYIDMYGGTTASSYTQPVFRIGNLGGITYNGSQLEPQWGVYTYNGYFEGAIVANEGKIANFTIASDKLYTGTHSAYNTNVNGIFIDDTYISFGKQALTYFKNDGTGKIGNWKIDSISLYNGTFGTANSAMISTGSSTAKAIGGSASISGWTFTSGADFGVTKTGELYSRSGKIASWIIDDNMIYTGTVGSANSAMMSPGYTATIDIGGAGTATERIWTFTSGADFGVTDSGEIFARSGNIGGWTIDADMLSYGTWGTEGSAMLCPEGTTDEKTIGGTSNTGWTFTSGANFGVTNTGAMYAKSGKIAGFTINSSRIYYSTLGNDKSVNISTGTSSTVSIGGSASGTTNYWTITSGANFGVTREGTVYANDVYIQGAINATSLHVGTSTSTNYLIYENSTINLQTDWLKFDSSTSTVTIGKDNAPRVGIDEKSMYIKNNTGGEYFYVGDVRSNNIYQFTTSNPERCIASQTTQIITNYKINLNYNVSIKDQDGNSVSYTEANESGVITGTFVKNRVYYVAYTTSEPVYRMYFGNKLDTSTIATSYNHALIIGNGTTSSNRPPSLALDWSGNLTCAGTITCSSKIPIRDAGLWNGISMTVWCCGSVVTANFYGTERVTIGAGAQNAYFTLPVEYRPFQEINQIFVDQNNRRVVFKVKTNGEIGIYYLLDGITSPTNLWGSLTWIAYQ